jgi:hypothetical protein
MKTTIQSIAPDELFHQIALVSVKPLLATTISHELCSSSEFILHPELELTYSV